MIELDNFSFMVAPDDDSGDVVFMLTLGEHSLKTYITGWSNGWETISQGLEEYMKIGHGTIELDYDTEPTKLTMTRSDTSVILNVSPSGFTNISSFEGRCIETDFIQKLYFGLLYGMTYRYDDIGCGWNWNDCKMVCYNKMKSRSIEGYLKNNSFMTKESYVTKHVLVVMNDEILHICDETIGYHIPITDKMDVYDKSGNVIANIDGKDIMHGNIIQLADNLPYDFDLWTINQTVDGMVNPQLILRSNDIIGDKIFIKDNYKVTELGKDPYGFTSETLWTGCNSLDLDLVKHFLAVNADTTYIFRWILNSNEGGTCDSVGNPTFEETELAIRQRDEQKAKIIKYVLDLLPQLPIKESDLKICVYYYCPLCLKILLENGANPNEKDIEEGWCPLAVRYRSVLSLLMCRIKDGKEKYGILDEMKMTLEAYGAENLVIWNDEYPDIDKIKEKENNIK